MYESDSDLLLALQGIGKTVNQVLTNAKGLVKSIEKIDNAKALERQDYLTDLLDSLKSNDLAITNAQNYEYIATAPYDHFETDEDADAYYDRILDYCGWIEISAAEFNRRTL